MDSKRLIFAIVLSVVVIVIYQLLFVPKPSPTAPATTPQTETTPSQSSPEQKAKIDDKDLSSLFASPKKQATDTPTYSPVVEDIKSDIQQNDIRVKTDLYTAIFTNKGAGMMSFILNKYKDDQQNDLDLISRKVEKYKVYPFYFSPFEGEDPSGENIYLELNNVNYAYQGANEVTVKEGEKKELLFQYADKAKNLTVKKKFIFEPHSYVIGLEYELIKDGKIMRMPMVFGPDLENNPLPVRNTPQSLKIGLYNGRGIDSVEFYKLKTVKKGDMEVETAQGGADGFFYWAAYETNYFSAIFKTDNKDAVIRYAVVREKNKTDKGIEEKLYSYMIIENTPMVYLGPKDEEILDQVLKNFHQVKEIVEYGFFGAIAKIMAKGINLAFRIVPNYGWAIILFTIFLKILLFPLTYASSVSMAKMQALQPKIKAIRKKYKNMRDPEQRRQMNIETMALYKKEKVNPASGCLPMLLQLPILFGLFRLLSVSIKVRHEPWILWIKDLSLKDPIYLIPILMGLTQIILQKMTPTAAEGSQKKMMYIMPIVITFIVMSLPSGLTLYWLVSNVLQIGQQQIINNKIFQKKKEEEHQLKANKRKKGAKNQ